MNITVLLAQTNPEWSDVANSDAERHSERLRNGLKVEKSLKNTLTDGVGSRQGLSCFGRFKVGGK